MNQKTKSLVIAAVVVLAASILLSEAMITHPVYAKLLAKPPKGGTGGGQSFHRSIDRSHPGLGCSPWDPRC